MGKTLNDLAIVGLGYVGLPLAQAAVRAGRSVIGFDVSERVVRSLNEGRSHVDDLDDSEIAEMCEAGFVATTDESRLKDASVVVICVPTPLSNEGLPDLGPVDSATQSIARNLSKGQLIILESTTYPGTTEERLLPILQNSGYKVGSDFFLAYSPERVDPGNPKYGISNTPKVVGGVTEQCTKRAVDFYSSFIEDVVPAKGTKEAETAKLLENTYRHINIALVNEMAKFSNDLGIDIWNVIDCAATKPFGFQAFYPGPGVGGHCIPIDPNYLAADVKSRLKYPFRFVELAQEINASMPAYVVRRTQDLLNDEGKALNGSKVLMIGVTYKPDIADQRESPALVIAQKLEAMGAKVEYFDPYVSAWEVGEGRDIQSVDEDDLSDACADADLTLIIQNHESLDFDLIKDNSKLVFDTRGKIDRSQNVKRL